MKLMFEFDREKNKIVFFGNGFEISSPAETYEDIAEFAKDVIENDIGIPNLKHREGKKTMTNVENLSELIAKAERSLWGKSVSNSKERQKLIAEYLVSNNVVIQNEAEWETFTEVKNNTVCGDGVKIQHKRCSNCKQPMGLVEECFCGKCGARIRRKNKGG